MTTNNITKAAIAAALMAIIIPFKFSVSIVPITLTVFILSLLTLILKPKEMLTAVLAYWAMIAIGIPGAVGYKSGIGVFVSIWSGYFWGYIWFPIMSIIGSKLKWNKLIILFTSLILLYLSGVVGLVIFGGYPLKESLKIGVLPFWLIDSIKIVIAFVIYKKTLFRVAK